MKLAALVAAAFSLLGVASAGVSSTCRNGRVLFVTQKQLDRPTAIYVVPFAGGAPVRAVAGAHLPSWSPRGDRLAYVRGRTLLVGPPRGAGRAVATVARQESIVSVVWAPVGDAVAYTVADKRGNRSLWIARSHGAPRRLVGPHRTFDVERPSWSPDGRELVVSHTVRSADGVQRSSLQIVVAATARVRSVSNSTGAATPQWSPDGKLIAFFSNGFNPGLKVIAPDGSGRRSIGGTVTNVVWSPDATRILGLDQDEERVAVITVADGTERTVNEYFNAAGWDPSGRWLVGTTSDGLAAVDPSTDEARTIVPRGWTLALYANAEAAVLHDGRIAFTAIDHPYGDVSLFTAPASGGQAAPLGHVLGDHPAWSPSGRAIAYDRDGRVFVADAKGAHGRVVATGSDPAWSPDGQKLAVARAGHVIVVPVAGGAEQDVGSGGEPAWSPDGTQIAVAAAGEIAAYPAAGGAARVITHVTVQGTCPQVGVWSADAPAWSPDGKTIAFGLHYANCSARGLDEIAEVDVASGNVWDVATPNGVSDGYFSPSWSPDGTTLVAAYLPENTTQRIIRLDDEHTVWAGATDAESPAWQPICS